MFSDWSSLRCVVLGTGPGLAKQRQRIIELHEAGQIKIIGVNNTFNDFPLDAWIACDPQWHRQYSPVHGDFDMWHWDKEICQKYGYNHIEGRWEDGLSNDKNYIHFGHSSGYQSLGLSVHYGAKQIYLAGFDMHYKAGEPRHYFSELSPEKGEYPSALRKYSAFEGLIECYKTVAEQQDRPIIYNLTEGSALKCFPYRAL